MATPKGLIVYEGPSMINGAPIVVIATLKTDNPKTGNTIQTWILHRDIHPVNAVNTGDDEAICGDCPLRGIIMDWKHKTKKTGDEKPGDTVNKGRGCYVRIATGPRAVWQAYKNGNYTPYNASKHLSLFAGRVLRLGSYGEPVAIPYAVMSPMMRVAKATIGYTHQWRLGKYWRWRKSCMASVHSIAERHEAMAMGWRTFRTRLEGQPLEAGEFICPASPEGNNRLDCERCKACGGGRPEQASPVIIAHGGDSKITGITNTILAATA